MATGNGHRPGPFDTLRFAICRRFFVPAGEDTAYAGATVPYEGLAERHSTFRVAIITSGSQSVLKLRWIGEEAQREEIAQEFKGVLQGLVKDKANLGIGSFEAK